MTTKPTSEAMPERNPDATSDANKSLRNFSGLIALIGAGKMGGALLDGWLRLGLDPEKLAVLEPEPLPSIAALAARGVRLNPAAATLRQADVVIIAIKPQAAAQALSPLAANVSPSALIISIMAGRTLHFLSTIFPRAGAMVRAMPNTPAAIGRGITVAVAAKLARETIAGSGELLHQSNQDAATLRQNVTSPGGTTAAALAVLMRPDGLIRLMSEAIAAATARSRELAG